MVSFMVTDGKMGRRPRVTAERELTKLIFDAQLDHLTLRRVER
jgi:hypothetical protein